MKILHCLSPIILLIEKVILIERFQLSMMTDARHHRQLTFVIIDASGGGAH